MSREDLVKNVLFWKAKKIPMNKQPAGVKSCQTKSSTIQKGHADNQTIEAHGLKHTRRVEIIGYNRDWSV